MPLSLPPDEARSFLDTAEAPTPMLDLVGLMTCEAVLAARRLGLFDALASGPATGEELATRLAADPVALKLLLDLLVTTGYVRQRDGYVNSPAASAWLCRDSPVDYGSVLSVWHAMIGGLWGDLADAVRSGRPRGDFYAWLEGRPELLADFQTLQRGLAAWLAEEVLDLAPLPDRASTLLDLGGGHGLYSDAFCRRYPELTATVVDLPGAVATASDLGERVVFRAGDLTRPHFDRDRDVVLLFNVLHGFPEDRAAALVGAAAGALREGGVLLVLETTAQHRGGVADSAFASGFSLNLWHTQGGRVYPADTVARWMTEAGCADPKRHELRRSTTHTLFAAGRGR